MQSGYFYAPIVHVPPKVDLTDFAVRKGLRTRYAKHKIKPETFQVSWVHAWEPGDVVYTNGPRPICGKITAISKHGLCEIQVHPDSDVRYHLEPTQLRSASLLEVIAWESQ